MKIIARTLAILSAALLVCGATFVLGDSSFAQTASPSGPGRDVLNGQPAPQFGPGGFDNQGSGAPGGFDGAGRRGHDGGRGPSSFGVMEALQNLAIVAAIVAVVAPLLHLARRRRKSASRRRVVRDAPMASD
ncbi:MAG TPA: hypothetical protein VE268_03865 [Herpetosiphonaceae bacterium]|nr:hypothetical protein [Herpetosiphonaceae bacterium]